MSKNSIFSPKKTVIFHPSKQVFNDTERWSNDNGALWVSGCSTQR